MVIETPTDNNATSDAKNDLTIQVNQVSKNFGRRRGVQNITFNIQKGEVVGFLGPNGAGKTTTMRLLTSFYTPDTGSILINKIDAQEHDIITRSSIGYLPENNPLYADLLVSEYLEFVADLRGMTGSERRDNLERTIEEVGISEHYYLPINQLSKGYRQRVGLAQAILHRPTILIMDEPTEGLDPNQRITIRDTIKSLGKDRTVLLSTHVMQEVETTCERVIVISNGQLVADKPVKDILKDTAGLQIIHIELEGNEIETNLRKLPNIESIERGDSEGARKKYTISTSGDKDLRPDIFNLAKKQNWVLWELREGRARLEEVFHSLTSNPNDLKE